MTMVSASNPGARLLDRYFGFAERGTTLARDTAAGATTFVVMSYIIFVNPAILSFAGIPGLESKGLPFDGVLASTCLVAGVMSIAMGLVTNYAYAIAPGMGLNAVVAFGLVASGKATYPEAMGLVVLEGVAMVLLAVTGLRELIFRAIPLELKKAIAIGIGLFIAFIGLVNSGIVTAGSGTPVTLGSFTTWPIFVVVFGLVFTFAMRAIGFKGDLLVGIIGTTVLATLINYWTDYAAFGNGPSSPAVWPHHIASTPNLHLLGKISFDSFSSSELGVVASLVWVFSLFLSDFFDFSGTAIGVGKAAGYVDKDGNIPQFKKALVVDGLAAMAGGAASSSSATTYIESGSGVAAGGRTGWVAVVAGLLFFPFMFFSPLIGMVPAQATAPALIVVGWLMISTLTEMEGEAEGRGASRLAGIDFHDLAIGLSAALAIMIMPFTYSITNGIGFGFITYTVICAARREWNRIHPVMWLVTGAFVLYFLIPLLQQHYAFFGGH
ncbi:MAG: adenine/guanine/hypoxanthine permease [Gaiellaceae bacterium]|nr:adenine/guanine/hypoxanthine permease [Gaiellaceae bacterium]